MLSNEELAKAAARMEQAADKAAQAAERVEAAAHRIALLLEDGYGGNGLKLIELLEKAQTQPL